jgi:hypothetical protein
MNTFDGKVKKSKNIKKKICDMCTKKIDGNGFKSIKWNGKGVDYVIFCDLKCMEDFNWKAYKLMKKNK